MEIIEGPVDSGRPGMYWDGSTMWIVGKDTYIYNIGCSRHNYSCLEGHGSMTADDAIGIIDAVERVLRTHDGRSD